MYELTVVEDFSAAHSLPSSGGKCERLHGHNWKVEVQVWADRLDEVGMAIDFHDLRSLLRPILEELDHSHLNDHPAFQTHSPTAENIARHIYQRLADLLPAKKVRMGRVRIWESEDTAAAYTEALPPVSPPEAEGG